MVEGGAEVAGAAIDCGDQGENVAMQALFAARQTEDAERPVGAHREGAGRGALAVAGAADEHARGGAAPTAGDLCGLRVEA